MTYEAKVRPWLLVLLVVVIIAGGIFIYWYSYAKKGTTVQTSPTPTKSTTVQPTAEITSASNYKTYRAKGSNISFTYPKEWLPIDGVGLGEGSGVPAYKINFAVTSENNSEAKSLNDLTITIYWRGDATIRGYEDLYKSIIDKIQNAKELNVKVGNKDGKKYSDTGGLASNPTIVVVKEGTDYFITIENQKSAGLLNVPISEEQFNKILESFEFPQ